MDPGEIIIYQNQSTITELIRNIFKEGELDPDQVVIRQKGHGSYQKGGYQHRKKT